MQNLNRNNSRNLGNFNFSGFIITTALVLKKGHLITVLPYLGREFKISFEVYLSSFSSADWASVIHFTTGGNSKYYGERNPAIWVTKYKQFHVTCSLNGVPNKWFMTGPQPLKTWIPIIITQKPSNGEVNLQGFKETLLNHLPFSVCF